jgi:hypothetical protein
MIQAAMTPSESAVTDQHETCETLLAAGWVPNTVKGINTRHFTSLSLCLFQAGVRVGCVQGYGPTLAAAQADAVTEAAKWLRRHEREVGGDMISHPRRDPSTQMRATPFQLPTPSDDRE